MRATDARDVFVPANTLPELVGTTDSGSADTSTFGLDGGEPSHNPTGAPPSAGKSGWWRWVAPDDGYCTVDLRSTRSFGNPVLGAAVAVYRAPAILIPDVTTIIPVVKSYYSIDLGTSIYNGYGKVTFWAEAGKVYFIAVDAASLGEWHPVTNFRIRLNLRFYKPENETRSGLVGVYYAPNSNLGQATFKLTNKSAYNGSVQLFGKRHRFRGLVSPDGFFYVSVPQPTPPGETLRPPMTLAFDVLARGNIYTLDGIADADNTLFNAVKKFGKGNFFDGAGYYTHQSELANGDAGFGVGSLRITRTGGVRGSMELPDGQKLSYAAKLLEDSGTTTFIVCKYFFKGAGVAWLQLAHLGANNGLSYAETWYRRPAIAGNPFYPGGINSELYLEGGRYEVPAASGTPFDFLSGSGGNGKMAIPATAGESIVVPTELNLNFSANQFVFDAPNPFGASISFNRRTGLGTGKVLIPLSQPQRRLRVMCSSFGGNPPVMQGYLTGTTQTVPFTIESP